MVNATSQGNSVLFRPASASNQSAVSSKSKLLAITTLLASQKSLGAVLDPSLKRIIPLESGYYKACSPHSFIKNNGSLFHMHFPDAETSEAVTTLLAKAVNEKGSENCHSIFNSTSDMISSVDLKTNKLTHYVVANNIGDEAERLRLPNLRGNEEIILERPSRFILLKDGVQSGSSGSATLGFTKISSADTERTYTTLNTGICADIEGGFNYFTSPHVLGDAIKPNKIYSVVPLLTEPNVYVDCSELEADPSQNPTASLVLFKNENNKVSLSILKDLDTVDTVDLENFDPKNNSKITVDASGRRGLISSSNLISTFEFSLEPEFFGRNLGSIDQASIIPFSIINANLTTSAVYDVRANSEESCIHCGGYDVTDGSPVIVSIRQHGALAESAQFSEPVITRINITEALNYTVTDVQANEDKIVAVLTPVNVNDTKPTIVELDANSIEFTYSTLVPTPAPTPAPTAAEGNRQLHGNLRGSRHV